MLLGRDVAAQGVQLLATLLTAALLALWARRSFPAFRASGALAAAIFLGNPLVSYLAGTGYIEPGLTLFVTGGLFAGLARPAAARFSFLLSIPIVLGAGLKDLYDEYKKWQQPAADEAPSLFASGEFVNSIFPASHSNRL